MEKPIEIFIELLNNNSIKCDVKKFFKFCNKVAYFNFAYDCLFYEYAPMELRHRSRHTIKTLFEKFTDWNNGKRFFRVFEYDDPQNNYSVIEAKTANQSRAIYAKKNSIDYIECRAYISFSDCL